MAKAGKEFLMGADCGCGGACGMCAPRLAREMSYRSADIMEVSKLATAKTAMLARGSVGVGGKIAWLNPRLCDRAATEASQLAHIENHGAGPFEVTDIKTYRNGALTLVCFVDEHGKPVEISSDWLVAD